MRTVAPGTCFPVVRGWKLASMFLCSTTFHNLAHQRRQTWPRIPNRHHDAGDPVNGLEEGRRERPRLTIHAMNNAGNVIGSVQVEDDGVLDRCGAPEREAARILIGPADAEAG